MKKVIMSCKTFNKLFKVIIIPFVLICLHFQEVCAQQESGMIINEFSNGSGGTKEYMEFLVVGCPGTYIDLRGWKFDDNNGDFSGGPVSGAGIAPNHSRLSMDIQWSSVLVGSLILVYNSGDPNPSVPADDPTDVNNDHVYILSHANSSLIETCGNNVPTTGNASYTATTFGPGTWISIGLANTGDAAQVRKPDGSFFHGIGYGASPLNGGTDNLYFSGGGGSKVYSFTSASCNYRTIANFISQNVPAGETPGAANNTQNLLYINYLKNSLAAGIIDGDQAVCLGQSPTSLVENPLLFRCAETFQWQSSVSLVGDNFTDILNATSDSYSPTAVQNTSSIYYRRIVTSTCSIDTSNIVTISVKTIPSIPDKPIASDTLCLNPANSAITTNAAAGASSYSWEIYPSSAGVINGSTNSVSTDWNDSYAGNIKIVVKANNSCGQSLASDTAKVTIINPVVSAGFDQLNICDTIAMLTANVGLGNWTVLSGNGGSFSNAALYNSKFSGIQGETYTLSWMANHSLCTSASSDDVQIRFANLPSTPSASDTSRCGEGSMVIKATGGVNGEYRWYDNNLVLIPGQLNNTYTIPDFSSSDTFYVSLFNGICESKKVPVQAILYKAPTINLGENIYLIRGHQVELPATGNGSFSWNPVETLNNSSVKNPIATPFETTTYIATVTMPSGCVVIDSIKVFVVCDDVVIPNLITPNGDGHNDHLEIGCTQALKWNLEILNSWGQFIYTNNDYQNDWKAEGVSDGVYYYSLKSEVLNKFYKGWIEVMR